MSVLVYAKEPANTRRVPPGSYTVELRNGGRRVATARLVVQP